MTKVEAIKKFLKIMVELQHGKLSITRSKNIIQKRKKSKEWSAGICGVLYREIKNHKNFKKIDEGTFSVANYDETKLVLSPKDLITTKDIITAIRIGQNQFRKNLLLR